VAEVDEPDGTVKMKSSPVPTSVTVCGLPTALSVMVTAPVLVPPAVGLKVTLSVQEVLAARLEPQVLVWEKSPLVAMLEIVSVVLPLFARVIVSGGLVVPTTWLPKSYDAGERVTTGAGGTLYLVTKTS
jgi:hypothetical protein